MSYSLSPPTQKCFGPNGRYNCRRVLYKYVVSITQDNFQNQQKFLCLIRVCSSTKENVQAPHGLSRSVSALGLDKLHSKKVKKHISGLRRAVSNTHLGTSRNFAPRTSWVSTMIYSALVFVQFNLFWCLFTTHFHTVVT